MKRNFVLFCCFAATVLMISCGSSSSSDNKSEKNAGEPGGECYPDKTCNAGLLCDEESNLCIEDPENPVNDSDSSSEQTNDESGNLSEQTGDNVDTSSEQNNGNTDAASENDDDSGDTNPDDTDSTPDNDAGSGDSAPDSDNGDTTNENPSNLPECSPTSATPCIDSETINSDLEKTNLIWSGKAPEGMRWIDAVDYCKNLNEGGYSDWQLPSLDVLQTLVKKCEISGYSDGECSKFGDTAFFWSSDQGLGVFFYNGAFQSKSVDETFDARCVCRESEIRQVACTELSFTNAEWNSVSNITQTWDWEKLLWTPSRISRYNNEESSTSECRFTCPNNNCKDSSSGLTWSTKAQETMNWNAAVTYCDNLDEGGYDDWRLPTIDELRTLIQNCSQTETDGSCGVTDDCLSDSCRSDDCYGCPYRENNPGKYSKFGVDTDWFWSSSTRSDSTDFAWYVLFYGGSVGSYSKTRSLSSVRCVR